METNGKGRTGRLGRGCWLGVVLRGFGNVERREGGDRPKGKVGVWRVTTAGGSREPPISTALIERFLFGISPSSEARHGDADGPRTAGRPARSRRRGGDVFFSIE